MYTHKILKYIQMHIFQEKKKRKKYMQIFTGLHDYNLCNVFTTPIPEKLGHFIKCNKSRICDLFILFNFFLIDKSSKKSTFLLFKCYVFFVVRNQLLLCLLLCLFLIAWSDLSVSIFWHLCIVSPNTRFYFILFYLHF